MQAVAYFAPHSMANLAADIIVVSRKLSAAEVSSIFPGKNCQLVTATGNVPSQAGLVLMADEWEGEALQIPENDSSLWLIASTCFTLSEINLQHAGVARICGWKGWLQSKTWEVALPKEGDITHWKAALDKMGKSPVWVPDIIGLIAPATVARLVNEAWYVWKNEVSSREEIDLAMRLGTNYPKGPLAWGKEIGLQNIAFLLQKMELASADVQPHEDLKNYLNY